MAQYYSNELAGDTTGLNTAPVASVRPSAAAGYGARVKNFRATVSFASQASGSTIVLAKLPAGYSFLTGFLTTDTSTGTATVSIGTAASAAKYAAAVAYTSTNTQTQFGLNNQAGGAYSAEEIVIATTGTAALPASGKMVIDILALSPN